VDRPDDLFARESEWDALAKFAAERGSGIHLALLGGRRRQGKSYLLRRLVHATGGFYHQALEEDRRQALGSLGTALGDHLGVGGGRLELDDWDRALASLNDVRGRRGRPALVVLDEFPYLLAHSPEQPSVLQRHIDRSRDGTPPVRLVLCGSALSTMAGLLTGSRALRGRASHDVLLKAFDYRVAAAFWDADRSPVAFFVDSVLGGTPGYRDLVRGRAPRRPAGLSTWLADGPLNPSSALFREDEYLLTEERTLTDRALYHSVVGAIARGNSTQGTIAAALGRDHRGLHHPLATLESAGFVTRQDDMLRERRPIYRLTDPIIRFHHVVTRPDLARFEDRRTVAAWTDAQARFATHVLGPHFEHLAREFTFRYASPATTGGSVAQVGPAVINDAAERSQHQIDVVAVGRADDGHAPVLALGEAKHTAKPLRRADLERLERIRALVEAKHGRSASGAKLLLFSAEGFDRQLHDTATGRSDVELIDLDRMYRGS
jgi:hypothetical protein